MRTLMSAPPSDRVGRYPKHTFQVNAKPFTLQPMGIAPVLPRETLKNLKFEDRVVTNPILNPIIGWKQEFYCFYTRITDLLNDAVREMFVDPTNAEITYGVEAATVPAWYCAKGGVNWLKLATQRVCDTWFRDDGEVMADFALANGIPIVQVRQNSFLDSLTDKDLMPEGAAISGATDAGDLERLMEAFEQLRALGIANMTYEDFLRSYGIGIPGKDENKPELIWRSSDFQYPTNHIGTDATNQGVPTSAVSWVFNTGSRDPKFFKEPGFITMYCVTRPKIYWGGLDGSAVGFMKRAWDWMPNYLRGMPETQLKSFAIDTGPLGDRATNADGYFLDMRDLLLYGDQWQNVAADSADPITQYASHMLPLPSGTTIKYKYLTETMINNFFVDTAAPYVKHDGYFSLSVKGHEVDYTVGNFAEA